MVDKGHGPPVILVCGKDAGMALYNNESPGGCFFLCVARLLVRLHNLRSPEGWNFLVNNAKEMIQAI